DACGSAPRGGVAAMGGNMNPQPSPRPYTGRCPHCANQITEVVVLVDLAPIEHRLARMERALQRQGATLSDIHDEIGAGLADLTEKIAAVDTDLARELADF